MTEIVHTASPFDAIKRTDERGEHWSARELQPLLGYSIWRDFANAVDRAKAACHNSGSDPESHFADARKITGSGPVAADVRLTRYAAYLVAMKPKGLVEIHRKLGGSKPLAVQQQMEIGS